MTERSSTIPATKPGAKFSTASATPGTSPVRNPACSSSPLYSSPSVNSSISTPISAPSETNSSETPMSAMPPSPSPSPARR